MRFSAAAVALFISSGSNAAVQGGVRGREESSTLDFVTARELFGELGIDAVVRITKRYIFHIVSRVFTDVFALFALDDRNIRAMVEFSRKDQRAANRRQPKKSVPMPPSPQVLRLLVSVLEVTVAQMNFHLLLSILFRKERQSHSLTTDGPMAKGTILSKTAMNCSTGQRQVTFFLERSLMYLVTSQGSTPGAIKSLRIRDR